MKSGASDGSHAERAADVVEDAIGAGFARSLRGSHGMKEEEVVFLFGRKENELNRKFLE